MTKINLATSTTTRNVRRTLLLASGLSVLAFVLWPGISMSVFNQGEEPIIIEGWAQTGTASANAGACPSAQEVCVEWCRLINGDPMPIVGALCYVSSTKVENNNFGDCLLRVD